MKALDGILIPNDRVLAEDLQDPEFREEWNKTAPARWLAIELAHYRAERGLTQAQLAEYLGVDPEDVERMEDGTENPSLQELMCIAQRLGTEISARRSVQPSRQESAQPEMPRPDCPDRSAFGEDRDAGAPFVIGSADLGVDLSALRGNSARYWEWIAGQLQGSPHRAARSVQPSRQD